MSEKLSQINMIRIHFFKILIVKQSGDNLIKASVLSFSFENPQTLRTLIIKVTS